MQLIWHGCSCWCGVLNSRGVADTHSAWKGSSWPASLGPTVGVHSTTSCRALPGIQPLNAPPISVALILCLTCHCLHRFLSDVSVHCHQYGQQPVLMGGLHYLDSWAGCSQCLHKNLPVEQTVSAGLVAYHLRMRRVQYSITMMVAGAAAQSAAPYGKCRVPDSSNIVSALYSVNGLALADGHHCIQELQSQHVWCYS